MSDTLTVDATTPWHVVLDELGRTGRRPALSLEDLGETVGASTARHALGDSSHLRGEPAIVATGDRVTVAVVSQAPTFAVRQLSWNSVLDFTRDVLAVAALESHDFVRARVFWGTDSVAVRAFVGSFARDTVDVRLLYPAMVGRAIIRGDLRVRGAPLPPSLLRLAFALPDGLVAWHRWCEHVGASGLGLELARGGSSIWVVPDTAVPQLRAKWSVVIALRTDAAAPTLLDGARSRALELGAMVLP